MLRSTYDRILRLAASPDAPAWLALLAFCEGIFFPIPPDVMLAPMTLARRERAWRYGAIVLVASVLGGSVGYMVGHFLSPVGAWLLQLTGSDAEQIRPLIKHWGVLLLAVPIPYKLTAIASGMFKIPFPLFLGASIVIRGLRFFLVAGLIRQYGAPMQEFVERRLGLVVSAVALALIGLVVAIRFAF
jgi:membrane protein YqaA with SNARE-associated domain